MKYAFFLGCNIPARVKQYELSSRAVLKRLGVELVDFRRFNCCGYPLRNLDERAFLLSAAKNLALAEQEGLDLLALCKCCFGSLKKAAHLLAQDPLLKNDVNGVLREKGLQYTGKVQVKHLLTVLRRDVGLDKVKNVISRPFDGLKIATHYGCHALRPSTVTQFDDPVNPTLFDEMVEATGAESIDWLNRLECCGAPLLGINDDLSTALTGQKIRSAKEAGADYLCTACPYCHLQFDWAQEKMTVQNGNGKPLPAVLYTQLLGLSMGLDGESLGIDANRIDINGIIRFFRLEKKNVSG
jgi:heterodisulfide reductase subunit B2